MALANRNYMNLLELPVLFYLACILAHLTGATSALMTALAWAYVALRIAHSVIQCGRNKVLHRFYAYAAGGWVLWAMWLVIAWHALAR